MKYLLIIIALLVSCNSCLHQDNVQKSEELNEDDILRILYYDTTKWDMPFDDFKKYHLNYISLLEYWFIDYDEYIKFANQSYWFRNNSFTSYGYFRGHSCYTNILVKVNDSIGFPHTPKRMKCHYFDYQKYYGMKFKDALEAIENDYNLNEPIKTIDLVHSSFARDRIYLFFSYKYDENFIAEFRVYFDVNCYKGSSYDDIKIEYIYDCIEYDIETYLIHYEEVINDLKSSLAKEKKPNRKERKAKMKEIKRLEELFEKE